MLTKAEIQKLYSFVLKHKVKYVDVQIELVDHLASEIELIRNENPSINFQKAMVGAASQFDIKTYSQWPSNFGETKYVNGFKALVNQKVTQTSKLLNRRMNEYLASFFRIPKIIFTISIWIIIYYLIQTGNLFVVMFSVLIFHMVALCYWAVKTYQFQKEYGKFSSINFQSSTFIGSILVCFLYPIMEFIKWFDVTTYYFPIIVTTIFTFLILAAYIGFIYFTDLLISEVKERYGDHYLNFV